MVSDAEPAPDELKLDFILSLRCRSTTRVFVIDSRDLQADAIDVRGMIEGSKSREAGREKRQQVHLRPQASDLRPQTTDPRLIHLGHKIIDLGP